MYLLLSIILSAILGIVLFLLGPVIGGIIAFAIVMGCVFRATYLLGDLHKRIGKITSKRDKVQEAYEDYLKEKRT